MDGGGHAEDAVELLERLALGLGYGEQDGEEADEVPARVPAKSALGLEGGEHAGPGDGQDKVEEPRGGRGDGHAERAHIERVRLGAVRERYGALARRVDDAEQIQAQRHARDVRLGVRRERDVEREASKEQREGHERKCDQQQVASTKRVDSIDGRDSEEEVDDAEAQAGTECALLAEARFDEDGA